MEEAVLEIDDDSSSSSSFCEFLIRYDPEADLSGIFQLIPSIPKISIYGHVLRSDDLSRLVDGHWLNDKIINTYMYLLMLRYKDAFVFSTYAYPTFKETPLEEACSWFSDTDLFAYEYLVFPIHKNSHWTLIIFNGFLLNYYDSVGGIDSEAVTVIKNFLVEMYKRQRGESVRFVGRSMAKYLPFQENCDDCGVFCCMYARFSVDIMVSEMFKTEDIPMLRKKMLHEILAGEIIYEYN